MVERKKLTLPCAVAAVLLLCSCEETRPFLRPIEHLQEVLKLRAEKFETYYIKTDDGWDIALHRRLPPRMEETKPPVILCHGVGQNGKFWELDQEHDVATLLWEAGYDAWILDLRGCGFSTKPAWTLLHAPDPDPEKLLRISVGKFEWTLDDHIMKDVPAAIALVQKVTHRRKVAWVGHSLGSIVILGYLERSGSDDVCAVVACGCPMLIPQPPNNIMRDIQYFTLAIEAVNNRLQSLAGVATAGQIKSPVDMLFYNPDNVDLPVLTSLFLYAAEDSPRPLVKQLLQLAATGELRSYDGKYNYTANLSKVKTPVMFLAGKVDNMAVPEAVRYAYHAVSSKEKGFRLFGLANGDSIDYGHNDLIIGRRAPKEVYPVILDWLSRHARIRPDDTRGSKRRSAAELAVVSRDPSRTQK